MSEDLIAASLEAVAERHGDPGPEIYRRMYAAFPETEALFVRDTTGAVRGEMLAMAFQCLLGLEGPFGANMIRAEIVNHEGWGVSPEAFGQFFPIVRDTCRDLLGEAWTAGTDAAWTAILKDIDTLIGK